MDGLRVQRELLGRKATRSCENPYVCIYTHIRTYIRTYTQKRESRARTEQSPLNITRVFLETHFGRKDGYVNPLDHRLTDRNES